MINPCHHTMKYNQAVSVYLTMQFTLKCVYLTTSLDITSSENRVQRRHTLYTCLLSECTAHCKGVTIKIPGWGGVECFVGILFLFHTPSESDNFFTSLVQYFIYFTPSLTKYLFHNHYMHSNPLPFNKIAQCIYLVLRFHLI